MYGRLSLTESTQPSDSFLVKFTKVLSDSLSAVTSIFKQIPIPYLLYDALTVKETFDWIKKVTPKAFKYWEKQEDSLTNKGVLKTETLSVETSSQQWDTGAKRGYTTWRKKE